MEIEAISPKRLNGIDAIAIDKELASLRMSSNKFAVLLICLNLGVVYLTPQNFVKPLAIIKFPFLMMVTCFLLWLPHWQKNWTKQLQLMVVFFAYVGLYGLIGRVIIDSLVRNDYRSFGVWADLTMTFFGLCFPIAMLFITRSHLERLTKTCSLILTLLSIYVITHKGMGPGGWISDENDTCMALLSLFPLVLISHRTATSKFGKQLYLGILVLSVAAMVATLSRGGFLGLACILLYVFWESKHKGKALLLLFLGITTATIFVPSTYWKEMSTIRQLDQGTALTRREYWSTAIKMWLDPSNVIFGVGPANTASNIGDYQDSARGSEYGKRSMAGREVHSLYLQLLGDLGLAGFLLVGAIISGIFFTNLYLAKLLVDRITKFRLVFNKGNLDRDLANQASGFIEELEFSEIFLVNLNTAFVGVLIAGTFLSVLYYPPIWLLCGIGTASACYANKAIMAWDKFFGQIIDSHAHKLMEMKIREESIYY